MKFIPEITDIAFFSSAKTLMNKKLFQYLTFGLIVVTFGCKRHAECFTMATIPLSPYSSPVWFPDGSILGFNHIPIKAVHRMDQSPCPPIFADSYYQDSAGFWLINKDGSNMRRAILFQLDAPAWSPDGKWIAFCNGAQINKMAFDGLNFDTTHILRLTADNSNHFFPSWSPQGDTIYYDSDMGNTAAPYQIYKMAADGRGETLIGNKGIDSVFSREPFCMPDKQILHIRGDKVSTHVFIMDSNGENVKQVTNNVSPRIYIHHPHYFNSKVFFEDYGIWRANLDGSSLEQIVPNSTQGFSISKDSIVAFVNLDLADNSPNSIIDKTFGVIWLMNLDGSNERQFTYNNY